MEPNIIMWDKNWRTRRPQQGYIGDIYPEVKFPSCQYFDYFEFQEKFYLLNSIVKLNDEAKYYLNCENHYTQVVECYISNGLKCWTYITKIHGKTIYKCTVTVPPDELITEVTIPAKLVKKSSKDFYYKDSEVPEVIYGWVVYVLIMIFSIIFYDFLAIWFFVSIIFFAWRKVKLKKPSKHDYGF